ncbi:antitoxin [Streptacidiphilus sp. EB129]|uniref:antitoxin n=1 Tax=Streptacidiphilus sp. EB129 TaxID=3156262 RepID=UPI0035111F4F
MSVSDSLKGALDHAKEKATDFAGKHSAAIDSGLDKVGELADKATKGKYSDKINTGRDKAKEALEHVGGDKHPTAGETVEQPPETPAAS